MEISQIGTLFDSTDGASIASLQEALLSFSCSKDLDVQEFLHKNAIKYDIDHRARTYICIEGDDIIGYFDNKGFGD